MLGKTRELGIWPRSSEDLGITSGEHPPPLALQRAGHDRGTAALGAAFHDGVDELDDLISEAYSDLLAHTRMVPIWDAGEMPCRLVL